MLSQMITPRFNDTDALGHINNASISTWFEEARRPIFKIFVPDLSPQKWNLILARVEIDYLAQSHYSHETEVLTTIEKVGRSSFTILQTAIQNGTKIAEGKTILVHFDYKTNEAAPIPEEIKEQLKKL